MTQLCVIPSCRIRNRHLPTCETDCLGCLPRVADEGLTCEVCLSRTRDRLATIAELAPDARAVARGEVKRGSGGYSSGPPGPQSPGNDDAMVALGTVGNTLGGWVRHIAEERGIYPERVPAGFDTIAPAARFLGAHLGWLRHRAEVDEFMRDVGDCAARMRSLVDGRAEQRYLGPCGATRHCEGLDPGDWPEADCGNHAQHPAHDIDPCDGDVYGIRGASKGRCKSCGAEHDQGERTAWLDGEVRQHAFTAKDIADAHRVNVKTIRTWAARGQLKTYWRTELGIVTEWSEYAAGLEANRLHYVGDVLDLAAADAARRESRRSERERLAAKQAEDERLSA